MLLFYPFRNEQTEVHQNRNILKKYDEVKDEVETEWALFEPDPKFMEELDNNLKELDEGEEEIEEEEESATHGEVENKIKTKKYNGDTNYRMQERKNLNNRIMTLNKEQGKYLMR